MSRKRDTNWSKEEITVLLDSIMEITKSSAEDGKKTNSREVFEYAAKKMAERGHGARAEREKCRTKWKKMKEEFTHCKKSREGIQGYKEAPGIVPFMSRMEEFINGNFDNISPHSTIVRRTSSLSSSKPSPSPGGHRASARIAASTNGTPSSDNNDTSSTIATKFTTVSSDYPSSVNASPTLRQNSRLTPGTTSNNVNNITALTPVAAATTISLTTSQPNSTNQTHLRQHIPNHESNTSIYTSYSGSNGANNINNSNSSNKYSSNNSVTPTTSTTNTSMLNNSTELTLPHAEHDKDISYRFGPGCRQVIIFGDHDVDIKFRKDHVIIKKVYGDFQSET